MDHLVPTIRDLRPYPESPEARACGCPCTVAKRRGKPLISRTGSPVFAIVRNCPVHDNPKRELAIWDGCAAQASGPLPVVAVEKCPPGVPYPELELTAGANPGAAVNTTNFAKTLDGFQFSDAGIDEELVREIHSGSFLDEACNILFVGATGTGKTHLAQSVAGEAARIGKRGYFFTAFDLARKLEYEFQGGAGTFMFDLAQADFVVIDELGYAPISPTGRTLLYHLFARLDEKTSVIVTSHLPLQQWTHVFSDPDMTSALVDRFACRCHIVETGSQSWRASIERTRQKLARIGSLREAYSAERPVSAERKSAIVASA